MIRVLLADDDPDILAALSALLAIDPQIDIVATVPDGETALAHLHTHTPDVVVLDVRMPGSGPELVRSVLLRAPATSIVCFSADRSSRQHMLDAGAFAFADKADPNVDLIGLVRDAHSSIA